MLQLVLSYVCQGWSHVCTYVGMHNAGCDASGWRSDAGRFQQELCHIPDPPFFTCAGVGDLAIMPEQKKEKEVQSGNLV